MDTTNQEAPQGVSESRTEDRAYMSIVLENQKLQEQLKTLEAKLKAYSLAIEGHLVQLSGDERHAQRKVDAAGQNKDIATVLCDHRDLLASRERDLRREIEKADGTVCTPASRWAVDAAKEVWKTPHDRHESAKG